MSRFPMRTFQQDAILKRLSEGLVALEVSNVKTLTTEQCNKLQCGDVVVKKDSMGEHAYVVTFKSDTGMCLTYSDASVVETQSYDKTDNAWVYNSEDKIDITNTKPLYFHPIAIGLTSKYYLTMIIINNDSTPFTRETFIAYLKAQTGRFLVNGAYYDASFYLSPSYVQKATDTMYLIGIDSTGTGHTSTANTISFDTIVSGSSTFEDEVNKIN